ncbi:ABC transporter permease subunit [Spongiibacter nanhainus]|uniref:ABC transporter permease subunit n=1 Tax=Spongiibacter nanhainus TaxID=2794344 RepID=A0A7T4US00_9GAMM|nr:ABC transporter permease subunit [Spongiibacter nanhainus]QQD19808.1 ABC transporter permease subunit [Spongiibacter nanhainus]
MTQFDVQAAASRRRHWRQWKDRATTATITAGGVSVLVAILLIFFYLLYEILPLFESARVEADGDYRIAVDDRPLYLALEEQAEVALRLGEQGSVLFFDARSGAPIQRTQLDTGKVPISSFSLESEASRLMALGLEDGRVLLAQHNYRLSYHDGQRQIRPSIDYPRGTSGVSLAQAPLSSVAVRDGDRALTMIGISAGKLVGKRWRKEENFLTGEVTLQPVALSLPTLDITADRVLVGPVQRWLYVLSNGGEYRLIDLQSGAVADRGRLFEHDTLNQVRFLLGGISLMAASDRGAITQFFVVRDSDRPSGHRLQTVRHFQSQNSELAQLLTEHRRKGFLAIGRDGQVDIFHSTAQRRLLSRQLAPKNVISAAIAPRADALLVETSGGQLYRYKLHNEHPEISWSVLWDKIWYESYPEPDYIWQSSASNNDFEPKYSFAPLAFGTLKAAFYAMLLAAPLAICGAIYTAYFMSSPLRRKVKPIIELMEALPTVILGFLAGLWLAPFIEKNLPSVFSVFLVMPMAILLTAWGWSRLPLTFRQRIPDGIHPVLLVPVVLAVVVGCVMLSAPMEQAFFNGDMRAWLTNDLGVDFDQRNALVVGVAMGFAVIPTIFSIAEDAIFSVPKHLSYGSLALGATTWQSLVGVVLPTASPGIFSALMIGMGRAVGETMIVLMATGNTPIMDANIFEGMRTLSANIAVEIGETEVDSTHFRVLFLAAFVLFMFTFCVNTVAEVVRQRLRQRYGNL